MTKEKTLQQLRKEVKDYLMDDTHRKEIFTDIEICCEDDNDDANKQLEEIVEKYTLEDCKGFMKAMQEGLDLCYEGWVKESVCYP